MTNLCNDLQSVIEISPKLHSWIYYIIDSTNVWSYTTETYESLHKNLLKYPIGVVITINRKYLINCKMNTS